MSDGTVRHRWIQPDRFHDRRRRCLRGLRLGWIAVIGIASGLLMACSPDTDSSATTADNEVVVYTALDQIFSEPLLQQFEEQTGIRVRAVYDAESVKTVGLVNRLLSEKASPRADVFWNNEIIRTLLLKREGVTEAYASPMATDIPASFRDSELHWTGFAARARVIIYNRDLVQDPPPDSLDDLTKGTWKGRCAIAKPLFGTTATQAAVQWWLYGPDATQTFFNQLNDNQVIQLAGNATVRDQVALGEIPWGLTDTDDANGAILDGRPVGVTYPVFKDPASDNEGILLIPNTVCLIRNSPNPEAGKRLIDFLLSPEVESYLAAGRGAQLPLRPGLQPPPGWEAMSEYRWLDVDWDAVLDALEPSATWLDQNYVE